MTEAAKPACVYCGAAPTSHAFLFVDTSITLTAGKVMRTLSLPAYFLFAPFIMPLTNTVTHAFLGLFEMFGWAAWSEDYAPDHLDRKKVIFDEAKVRGIKVETLKLFGRNNAHARAWLPCARGSKKYCWQYFEMLPIPPWLEAPVSRDIDNKGEFKKLFRKHGLKVPNGKAVMTFFGARSAMKKIAGPVIVKPLDGSRSRHTRIDISTDAELKDALMRAQQVCPVAIVEEYIPGRIYRATCIAGKVAGVMELVRPTIIADGVKTVDELRKKKNAHPDFSTLSPIQDDSLFAFTLNHQGLRKDSVPPNGTEVLLAEFSERTNGGYFVDVTEEVPASTITYLEKGAEVSKTPIIGFDVISRDLADTSEPVTFLEGNTLPFIEIHHIPYSGTPRNVAAKVLDMWFD